MRCERLIAAWLLALSGGLCLAHDGRPDPPPKHGGVVFTSGTLDVETVLQKPKGHYQIYFSDAAGQDVPAAVVSHVELTVRHATRSHEKIVFHVDDVSQTWVASSSSPDSSITGARLSYEFLDIPIQTEIPFSSALHAEFQAEPKVVKAGQTAVLEFRVKDFFGKSVPSLEVVHEKQMHLMIVSQDLGDFYHIHPEPAPGDVFRVPFVFRYGGNYKLYADYTSIGGNSNHIDAFDLKVDGAPRPPVTLDTRELKTVAVGGIRMTLAADRPLRTGEDIPFSISLFDAQTNAPIQDLQPYLGAWAHIAVVSQDLQDFIHIHPFEDVTGKGSAPSPSSIRTVTGFRRSGLYKMWVQVQRDKEVTAVPFVFRVQAGSAPEQPVTRVPSGAILVRVSSAGFDPSLIPVKAGRRVKLAFFRQDAENCGREVVFPALGIQRELPVGQTVVIDVTPRKTGSLSFSCGMKMLHGELLVQ
jgi:Cupredoxin-like domain